MSAGRRITHAPQLVGGGLHRALRLLRAVGAPPPRLVLEQGEEPGRVVGQHPAPGQPWEVSQRMELRVAERSLMEHLPEIFREDDAAPVDAHGQPRAPGLLERSLWVTHHVLGSTERIVDYMDEQLTPETASPEMLSWLAARLPLPMEAHWGVERVREVLRRAPELLARRGSAAGLAEILGLRTGVRVRVVEGSWPHGGIVAGRHRVGRQACVGTVPYEDEAFYVVVEEGQPLDHGALLHLLEVLEQDKPVHLRACVVRAEKLAQLLDDEHVEPGEGQGGWHDDLLAEELIEVLV